MRLNRELLLTRGYFLNEEKEYYRYTKSFKDKDGNTQFKLIIEEYVHEYKVYSRVNIPGSMVPTTIIIDHGNKLTIKNIEQHFKNVMRKLHMAPILNWS